MLRSRKTDIIRFVTTNINNDLYYNLVSKYDIIVMIRFTKKIGNQECHYRRLVLNFYPLQLVHFDLYSYSFQVRTTTTMKVVGWEMRLLVRLLEILLTQPTQIYYRHHTVITIKSYTRT